MMTDKSTTRQAGQSKLEFAEEYARKHHAGQKRWGGEEYITHPLAVAELMRIDGFSIDTQIVAVLHDIIEDTSVSVCDLRAHFGDRIAFSVASITKQPGENYYSFIKRICNSEDATACAVKMYDLQHNMSDLKEGSMKDKYRFAYDALNNAIGGQK